MRNFRLLFGAIDLGIFFKDMSLGENTPLLATLDPTHQMPFLC